MATPVLAEMRARWPKAKMTAMCQGKVADLLRLDPHIDAIFSYHKPNRWVHRVIHGELVETIQRGEYDLGIILPLSFSSAWWFWRGHVARRVGYPGHFRRWLLTDPIPLPEEAGRQHLVTTYKQLLCGLGIPLSTRAPQLYLSDKEVEQAKERIPFLQKPCRENERVVLIGINPGAAYGSAKCWPPNYFQELCRQFLQHASVRLLFFGDTVGASLVGEICRDLPPEKVLNFAGKTTLRELMSLLQCCQLLITNDSGPMHIASALQVPLVALFGSTDPVVTGPYNGGEVLYEQVECSPCFRRVCPIDFRCMRSIHPQEVYRRATTLLHWEYTHPS